MEDRSVASAGVVLSGLALVAAALPSDAAGVGAGGNAVLAALAATAFGAFSLRRRDALGRVPGSLVAGVASLGVVGYVTLATVGSVGGDAATSAGALGGGAATPSPWVVTLSLASGVGGVIAAYGDGRGFSDWAGRATKAAGRAFAVGFAGLFAIAMWASVLVSLLAGVVPGDPGAAARLAVGAVALGLGTGTVAVAYFRWTGKSLSYLDVRTPTLRDVGYVVAGVVVLFGLQVLVSVVFSRLGVSTASHSVQQTARGDAEVLLLLIPAAWLIIGPGEELLYRNIIQKSLYETFGGWGAVLVGSLVFALAHIPAYAAGASLTSLFNTLVVIFLLSLVLGAAYLRTENVAVSAVIHGTFDAIVFGAMYVQMTGAA